MLVENCEIKCTRCGNANLEERPGKARFFDTRCRSRDFWCLFCNQLVARWKSTDEDHVTIRQNGSPGWFRYSVKTGQRVTKPRLPQEKRDEIINHALMMIGMRVRYTEIRQILHKEYQLDIWSAGDYLNKAIKIEKAALARLQKMAPDELDGFYLQRSIAFWETVVRTASDLKDRMAAQRELDRIFAIHKPPKETSKNDKEDGLHVHFYIPDNNRSRTPIPLDQSPLQIPAEQVVIGNK